MRRFYLSFALVFLAALAARADDTTPPLIRHTPVLRAFKGDTVNIAADMEDESEIFAPTLYFRYPGAKTYSSIPMVKKSGNTYTASVQATADIEYWIEAYDEFGNGPTREGTPDRPHKITVTERIVSRPVVAVAPTAEPPPAPAPPPPPPPVPTEPTFNAPTAAENLPPPPAPPLDVVPTVLPEEPKPLYKQWWFIGGGAVVTAAVVTVAVIALQPSPVYLDKFTATFKH